MALINRFADALIHHANRQRHQIRCQSEWRGKCIVQHLQHIYRRCGFIAAEQNLVFSRYGSGTADLIHTAI